MARIVIASLSVLVLSFCVEALKVYSRIGPTTENDAGWYEPESYYAGVSDVSVADYIRVLDQLPRFERISLQTVLNRENLTCDLGTFLRVKKETNQDGRHGLIIAGQEGSATRAAQKVVQFAGTHCFGELSDNYDSWAGHWGHALDFYQEILATTGTVHYSPWDLHSEMRETIQNNMCATMVILQNMNDMANCKKPWALKEPRLRFMLPFYTQVFNIKFVHVTRDVRNIHDTLDDTRYTEMIQIAYKTLPDNRIQEALASSQRFLSSASGNLLVSTHDDPRPDVSDFKINANETSRFAVFAFAWAEIELSLYKKWTSESPLAYFHLCAAKMVNEMTKRDTTMALAAFLGNPSPDEATLANMMSVYSWQEPNPKELQHWNLMHGIITQESSAIVREALTTFGYDL